MDSESDSEKNPFPTIAVLAIFINFGLGLLGSIIPPLSVKFFPSYDLESKNYFRFFHGLAAGIVLGVGFVHSYSDSFISFQEGFAYQIENGFESQAYSYPWASLIAMIGAFLTFVVEQFLVGEIHSHSHQDEEPFEMSLLEEENNSQREESDQIDGQSLHFLTNNHHNHNQEHKQKNYVTEMYVLLFGLSFHSIFVGLALGVAENDIGLFIAIVAHIFFEGLAFGAHVARAKVKTLQVWILDLVFALSTPFGIMIGLGIKSSFEESIFSYAMVNGVFQGLSSGILIYVSLVHMMKEEISKLSLEQNKRALTFVYTGFITGMTGISIIGIWA